MDGLRKRVAALAVLVMAWTSVLHATVVVPSVADVVNEVSQETYQHYLDDLLYTVDTPGYIDYVFATNMVRSAVGYLAESAVLVPEPATVVLLALGILLARPRRRAVPRAACRRRAVENSSAVTAGTIRP